MVSHTLRAALCAGALLLLMPLSTRAEEFVTQSDVDYVDTSPLRWMPSNRYQRLLAGALPAGHEGNRVFRLCRVSKAQDLHLGKWMEGQCHIGYGGREEVYDQYELAAVADLKAFQRDYTWAAAPGATQGAPLPPAIAKAALGGGYEHGRPVKACLGLRGTERHAGKLIANRCNYGYGGAEVVTDQFAVLVPRRLFP